MANPQARAAEAALLAQEALDNGDMIFVARIRWSDPVFSDATVSLTEVAAAIQAIENAGWVLDRYENATEGGSNKILALFRRGLR